MRFRCERDVLVDALTTTGRAVAARGTGSAALAGVHLRLEGDILRLAGIDRDLTIQTQVTVAGSDDGAAVLPSRLAVDIVRSLDPGAVSLDLTEDEVVTISSGRSQFTVRGLPVEDFPRLSPPSGEPVTLRSAVLAAALRQVVRAASTDNERPVLTGVLMAATETGLRLVATDSYRLAVRDLPGSTVLAVGQKVLLPSRALGELQRLLSGGSPEVSLRLGEFEAHFEVGPTRLTTRLLEGEYPNYAGLIPKGYPNRLVVGREGLLDAVRRVRLMTRDATTPVRLSLRPDGVELTVITPDLGQATEDVDAKYEGTEFTIAFNPAFLAEGVEAIEGDEVALETQDAGKPATLRATQGPSFAQARGTAVSGSSATGTRATGTRDTGTTDQTTSATTTGAPTTGALPTGSAGPGDDGGALAPTGPPELDVGSTTAAPPPAVTPPSPPPASASSSEAPPQPSAGSDYLYLLMPVKVS